MAGLLDAARQIREILTPRPLTYTSMDAGFLTGAGGLPSMPVSTITVTNPGTTLTEAFHLIGQGRVLLLVVVKPSTTNSVHLRLELTIDGAVVVPDSVTATNSTGVQTYSGVRPTTSATASSALYLPFNKSCRLQVRFSATPGGTPDITVAVIAEYR